MTQENNKIDSMTLEEIRKAIEAQGSIKDFADKLKINANNLRLILAGSRPLTPQLKSHIVLLLTQETVHPVIYTVSLPSAAVRECLPTWGEMSVEDKRTALIGVLKAAFDRLVTLGKDGLTDAQVDDMKQVLSTASTFIAFEVQVVEPDGKASYVLKPAEDATGPAPIIRAHRPAARPME